MAVLAGGVLHRAANARGWSETTWNNGWEAGGSGCSAYVPKPSWQPSTDCPMRTVADVSAAAFNIPVYNSVYGGWVTVAGTRASAPLIAGVYGLAGNDAPPAWAPRTEQEPSEEPWEGQRTAPALVMRVRAAPIMCNTECMTSGRIIIGRRVGT